MIILLLASVLLGALTSLTPCVLPVLPVVLTAGASDRAHTGTDRDGTDRDGTDQHDGAGGGVAVASRRQAALRPVLVVTGLVLSFCASTLLGSLVLSALGLPQDLLRDLGIAMLLVIGVSLLVPRLADLLERPFARLPAYRAGRRNGNGLVLGLGLGLLYTPCAGPILAAIVVAGATHRVGWHAVLVTVAFGIGVGIPLLAFALAGERVTRRVGAVQRRARALRAASGAIVVVFAVAIAFNLTDSLQRDVPSWLSSVAGSVEQSRPVADGLRSVSGEKRAVTDAPVAEDGHDLGGQCTQDGPQLENCGRAPAFTGISSWINTPGDRPLTLRGLRGKVVLIDFWTYSCINCQRTLPHVEAWYRSYARDGFVVVGVHTPEFAFEHVRSNVVSQSAALGVKYPVALDNDYGTWDAYGNEAWPAEYLVDAEGYIRHVSIGEGGYDTTESLIRQLLHQAHPGASIGRSTDVASPDLNDIDTTETYLGYMYGEGSQQLHLTSGFSLVHDRAHAYRFPGRLDPDGFALNGTWTSRSEYLLAGEDAKLELSWQAEKIYLVLGGTGTVQVRIDGRYVQTVHVHGPPTLYELYHQPSSVRHVLTIAASPGIQAYDFTFG